MTQPFLGVLASALVVVVSLAFVGLFDFSTFVGWVSFYMLTLIPMQIVIVVLWRASPAFAAHAKQPGKGTVLLLATAAAAAVIAPLALQFVGEGLSPPGPIPSQFAVVVVPTAFFMAIAFGGWPFTTLTKNATVAGLLLLVASYLVTYVLFRLFFDYAFLQGTPVYLQSAPNGFFNGTTALVFYVTALAGMFLLLHFDLWPLTASPVVMKQPVQGILWSAIAIGVGAIVMTLTMRSLQLDPMWVLTRVTAPFIFGTIIVLNMLENTLFKTLRQPLKGVANAVVATAVGVGLAQLYGRVDRLLVGMELPSGAPGYDFELWLVNALLSVTFPFLIVHAAYFGFWPLRRG